MENKKQPEVRFSGFTGEWEQYRTKELCSISTGKGNTQDKVDNGKYPFYVRSATIERSNEYLYDQEAVLTVGDGVGTGKVFHFVNGKYNLHQRVYRMFDFNNGIYAKYFYYYFSKKFYRRVMAMTAKTSVDSVRLEMIADMMITLPSLKEQDRIIELLDNINNSINLHQQELTTLKQTKQGFLQKMFPKEGKKVPEVRFPGFTDDWEQRKLGDMMDVTSVKRIHQSDWTKSGIRFLRARDIVSAAKNEEPSDYLYISEEKYNEYSKISGKVSQEDLLVTGVGSIGVPLLITDDKPIYFKDGNIIWFKNEHKIDGKFFYYSFINNKIQKYIRDVAGIGTVGTYTIDSGKKTPISLPTYDEQVKIGSFFKKLDTTITLHQRELELLQLTKKAFLQKLFV